MEFTTAPVRCGGRSVSTTCSPSYQWLTPVSLKQAAEPENLAQETIIENLSSEEATRLAKVRNIGIAVRKLSPGLDGRTDGTRRT